MSLQIAPLAEAEIDAAVALWRACDLTRPWNDPHADARMAFHAPAATILAGRCENRLIATAMTGFEGHRAWVYYLAIEPSLQGHGYGAAMMRACEAWAISHGAPKIQLMVRSDNHAATAFYKSIGYQRQDVAVFGKRLDGL